MKFSKNLISKFVTIPSEIDTDKLMDDLTLKSFEIEWVQIRKLSELLVIGKCTSVTKHPQADKLNVCQVDCWSHGIFQILTGGENISEGKFVPTAIPGCFLPHINLQIDPRKMRGMDSNGMICSKWEIGINEDEECHWIWLLEEDFDDLTDEDIGKSLGQKYPRLEETMFEVKNIAIANRSDLTWHIWLSYDIAAIYDTDIADMSSMYIQSDNIDNIYISDDWIPSQKSEQAKNELKIIDQTNWLLRNYHAIYISTVQIKKSSFMTRTMCRDFECMPHDGRVDYGNIFMNITCQPIHCFDADKIQWNIYIWLANEGEEFEDLFGTVHILKSTDLVIKDDVKTIALAGVIWAANSKIDENTKNILLEVANFDPVYIRKTATRLNLRSDASGRFEKNINPLWTTKCTNMLINELTMYKDYYKQDMWDYDIIWLTSYSNDDIVLWNQNDENTWDISIIKTNQFIFWWNDIIIDWEYIINILNKLWFETSNITENSDWDIILFTTPSHRNDLKNDQDMYEEIARIYGYSNIPDTQFTATITSPNQPNIYHINRKSEDFWLADKYSQVETYPWISESDINRFGFWDMKLVKMKNSMDSSMQTLRPAIFPALLTNIANNYRFFEEIKIFDIAKTYKYLPEDSKNTELTDDLNISKNSDIFWSISGTVEHFGLGLAIYSEKSSKNRKSDNTLSLKNQISKYIYTLWIIWLISFRKTTNSRFHPNKQATIYIWETAVWYIWALHPMICEEYKLSTDADVAVAEINLSVLCDLIGVSWTQPVYYSQQDQVVDRDLSFVMPIWFDYAKVLDMVKWVENVVDMKVFDIYKLTDGTKSIGIKIYIHGDGNWSTDQINIVMTNCIAEVEKLGDVKLR